MCSGHQDSCSCYALFGLNLPQCLKLRLSDGWKGLLKWVPSVISTILGLFKDCTSFTQSMNCCKTKISADATEVGHVFTVTGAAGVVGFPGTTRGASDEQEWIIHGTCCLGKLIIPGSQQGLTGTRGSQWRSNKVQWFIVKRFLSGISKSGPQLQIEEAIASYFSQNPLQFCNMNCKC